jgi:hypothetical protein
VSIQFSRSTRSLNIDSYRVSRIGLAVGIILIIALILWFFFARVSIYASTQQVSLRDDGRLVAVFPSENASRIHPGQIAILRLLSSGDQPPLAVEGYVFDVPANSQEAEILVLESDLNGIQLTQDMKAQVDVEIDSITPFTMVLRYSGRFAETDQGSPGSEQEANAPGR